MSVYWSVFAITFGLSLMALGFQVAKGFRIQGEYGEYEGEASTVLYYGVFLFVLALIWPLSMLVALGYWLGRNWGADTETA